DQDKTYSNNYRFHFDYLLLKVIRTGLVTGAARGMRRVIALRLARDGLNAAVNDVQTSSSDLEKVRQEIEQIGRKSIAITADVSQ
ncbi:unnamed protein product, partial [Rotaria sp. Silwood1]